MPKNLSIKATNKALGIDYETGQMLNGRIIAALKEGCFLEERYTVIRRDQLDWMKIFNDVMKSTTDREGMLDADIEYLLWKRAVWLRRLYLSRERSKSKSSSIIDSSNGKEATGMNSPETREDLPSASKTQESGLYLNARSIGERNEMLGLNVSQIRDLQEMILKGLRDLNLVECSFRNGNDREAECSQQLRQLVAEVRNNLKRKFPEWNTPDPVDHLLWDRALYVKRLEANRKRKAAARAARYITLWDGIPHFSGV